MHFKSAAQPAAVGSRQHASLTACRQYYLLSMRSSFSADRCFPSLFAASARRATTALSLSSTTSSLAQLHHKLSFWPCPFGSCYSRRWLQSAYRFDSARCIPCRSPALGVQSSHRMRQTHR